MSFFSSPASVPVKQTQESDVLDPSLKAQREAIATATNAERTKVADAAKRRSEGRTMGTEGANAFFTAGPSGYGRTMGSANI